MSMAYPLKWLTNAIDSQLEEIRKSSASTFKQLEDKLRKVNNGEDFILNTLQPLKDHVIAIENTFKECKQMSLGLYKQDPYWTHKMQQMLQEAEDEAMDATELNAGEGDSLVQTLIGFNHIMEASHIFGKIKNYKVKAHYYLRYSELLLFRNASHNQAYHYYNKYLCTKNKKDQDFVINLRSIQMVYRLGKYSVYFNEVNPLPLSKCPIYPLALFHLERYYDARKVLLRRVRQRKKSFFNTRTINLYHSLLIFCEILLKNIKRAKKLLKQFENNAAFENNAIISYCYYKLKIRRHINNFEFVLKLDQHDFVCQEYHYYFGAMISQNKYKN
eukprot:438285_1